MEDRFARLMVLTEAAEIKNFRAGASVAHVPPDAIQNLKNRAALDRGEIEKIAGGKIKKIEQEGIYMDIETEGDDSQLVKPEFLDLVRSSGERSMLFELVVSHLGLGCDIIIGIDKTSSSERHPDPVRILVVDRWDNPSKYFYTGLLLMSLAADLVSSSYPTRQNSNGDDDRQVLRDKLVNDLSVGKAVVLRPARKLN